MSDWSLVVGVLGKVRIRGIRAHAESALCGAWLAVALSASAGAAATLAVTRLPSEAVCPLASPSPPGGPRRAWSAPSEEWVPARSRRPAPLRLV